MSQSQSPSLVQKHLRIQIPPKHHQVPVISQLVSEYGLIVNIKAAILDQQATSSGWFDISLQGDRENLQNGLNYLKDLDVEIWTNKDKHLN
ncbi:NIL domain-containing protein [Alkalinema sp. FACHB-956]|uniref:NIL domain-containing protein n=1 Tax=Alkalinema sp. FACHB-956 TaxID=2692768 RepID=UPI00168300FA|nr:NIL domain-containing protein [Alkalinema sp. FACHB-956]MBD2329988.1 NIL domain-containing protein [Alkalinema sp. FACHB-956]